MDVEIDILVVFPDGYRDDGLIHQLGRNLVVQEDTDTTFLRLLVINEVIEVIPTREKEQYKPLAFSIVLDVVHASQPGQRLQDVFLAATLRVLFHRRAGGTVLVAERQIRIDAVLPDCQDTVRGKVFEAYADRSLAEKAFSGEISVRMIAPVVCVLRYPFVDNLCSTVQLLYEVRRRRAGEINICVYPVTLDAYITAPGILLLLQRDRMTKLHVGQSVIQNALLPAVEDVE